MIGWGNGVLVVVGNGVSVGSGVLVGGGVFDGILANAVSTRGLDRTDVRCWLSGR
jgi:hypothetical protein